MEVSRSVIQFTCPGCGAMLQPGDARSVRCAACQWAGQVYLFKPLLLRVDEAEAALPEDAVCANHPGKRAVAVCAGTGDFICSLCGVEVQGKTYSAAFLNSGGKAQAQAVFDQTLARPDSEVRACLWAAFLVCGYSWPFVIPWAIIRYIKLIKSRREDPLLKRIVGDGQMAALGLVLGLITLATVVGVGFLVFGLGAAMLLRH